jgi:hypothetical protein
MNLTPQWGKYRKIVINQWCIYDFVNVATFKQNFGDHPSKALGLVLFGCLPILGSQENVQHDHDDSQFVALRSGHPFQDCTNHP